jgi:prepilin-type processing-associated H-X9-DG protein
MQCSNKQKQLALACHVYYDAKKEFPPNGDTYGESRSGAGASSSGKDVSGEVYYGHVSADYPGTRAMSAFVLIGPFIEQSAVYEQFMEECRNTTINSTVYSVYGWGTVGFFDPELLRQPAEFMACPSDSNANQEVVTTKPKTTNGTDSLIQIHRTHSYVVSAGDWVTQTHTARGPAKLGFEGWTRGPFMWTATVALEEITDGTSNTAMLTERCAGTVAEDDGVVSGSPPYRTVIIADASVIGSNSSTVPLDSRADGCTDAPSNGVFNPIAALTLVSGKNVLPGVGTWNAPCTQWYNGESRFTWANFILGPNAPAAGCINNGYPNNTTILPPQSYHTGGVNMALCDASVRFITDAVDTGTITSTATDATNAARCRRHGASNRGVWGAFGSRDGGEASGAP